MKKYIIFLMHALTPLMMFSQDKKTPIVFGIKAGALIANAGPDFTDENGVTYDYQPRFGVAFGGRAQVTVNKNFLIMPELNFIGKGANRYQDFNNGNQSNISPTLSAFLELTSNFLFTTSSKSGKFMLGGGPSAALNLDEYSDMLGKKDFGINIMAGYLLPIGFSFEINFNKGLANQRPRDPFLYSTSDIKTSSLGFSVGYVF
jgi:hypothetical protein